METSIVTAYTWSAITMIIFCLLAVVVAYVTPYQKGGFDVTKCKMWFWIFAALTPVVAFIINYYHSQDIQVVAHKNSFLMHSGIAAGVAFVLFIVIGVIVSKTAPRTKLGRWF